MSSCLTGGGRTYGFDLDIVKSQSTSTRTSQSSSPSSTLSESINSPFAISTRKSRTPRKRPNQTYNEAASLLSTVYPNIFSAKNLQKPFKHTKVFDSFSDEFSELLPPSPAFDNAEFLLEQIPKKPTTRIDPKPENSSEKPCQNPTTNCDFQLNSSSLCDTFEEDFDAESILDEEIEEGIDSIMGNLRVNNDSHNESKVSRFGGQINPYCVNPMGLGFGRKFDFGFGINGGVKAIRHVDEGEWWRSPTVHVLDISPKLNNMPSENKKMKKKKKKVEREEELKHVECSKEKEISTSNSRLCLKLNHEEVLNAWADRGSPFSDDIQGFESSESDAIARLAQIDLFLENGGMREASVLRYREKRRTRLFSKKIRYQVRKVNADRRPRMKGRFVRRPSSTLSS